MKYRYKHIPVYTFLEETPNYIRRERERERERAWHILILGLFSQLKTASQRFPRCGHFVPNRAGSICPQCFAVSVKAGDVLTNDQNSLCCEYESRDSPIMFKFLLIYFLDIPLFLAQETDWRFLVNAHMYKFSRWNRHWTNVLWENPIIEDFITNFHYSIIWIFYLIWHSLWKRRNRIALFIVDCGK